MPPGRRACPAVAVTTGISAVATDRNTVPTLTSYNSKVFRILRHGYGGSNHTEAGSNCRWSNHDSEGHSLRRRDRVTPRACLELQFATSRADHFCNCRCTLLEWTLLGYIRFVSSSHSSGLTVSSLISHKSTPISKLSQNSKPRTYRKRIIIHPPIRRFANSSNTPSFMSSKSSSLASSMHLTL